jgi:hypothetical protein
MACTAGHGWVAAGGRCADCGQPVAAGGPLGLDDTAPGANGWLAPPFADLTESRRCVTGGEHRPSHAAGTCADCGAGLEALDGTWFLTVAPTHNY